MKLGNWENPISHYRENHTWTCQCKHPVYYSLIFLWIFNFMNYTHKHINHNSKNQIYWNLRCYRHLLTILTKLLSENQMASFIFKKIIIKLDLNWFQNVFLLKFASILPDSFTGNISNLPTTSYCATKFKCGISMSASMTCVSIFVLKNEKSL